MQKETYEDYSRPVGEMTPEELISQLESLDRLPVPSKQTKLEHQNRSVSLDIPRRRFDILPALSEIPVNSQTDLLAKVRWLIYEEVNYPRQLNSSCLIEVLCQVEIHLAEAMVEKPSGVVALHEQKPGRDLSGENSSNLPIQMGVKP